MTSSYLVETLEEYLESEARFYFIHSPLARGLCTTDGSLAQKIISNENCVRSSDTKLLFEALLGKIFATLKAHGGPEKEMRMRRERKAVVREVVNLARLSHPKRAEFLEIQQKALKRLTTALRNAPETFDFGSCLHDYNRAMVLGMLFGIDPDSELFEKLHEIVEPALKALNITPPIAKSVLQIIYYATFQKPSVLQGLLNILDEQVASDNTDSLLVKISTYFTDNPILDEKGNPNLDETQIAKASDSLFASVAGVETTGLAMQILLDQFISIKNSNPDLFLELSGYLDKLKENPIDKSAIAYVDAVIYEALRLNMVISYNQREMLVDTKIIGELDSNDNIVAYHLYMDGMALPQNFVELFDLPAGSTISLDFARMNRDPKNFRDPLVVNPYRYLNTDPETGELKLLHNEARKTLSFSGGAYICSGEPMAMHLLRYTLAGLKDLIVEQGMEVVQHLTVNEIAGATNSPKNPLLVSKTPIEA